MITLSKADLEDLSKGRILKDGIPITTVGVILGQQRGSVGYERAVEFNLSIPVILLQNCINGEELVFYRYGTKAIPLSAAAAFAETVLSGGWMLRASGIFLFEKYDDYSLMKMFLIA